MNRPPSRHFGLSYGANTVCFLNGGSAGCSGTMGGMKGFGKDACITATAQPGLSKVQLQSYICVYEPMICQLQWLCSLYSCISQIG